VSNPGSVPTLQESSEAGDEAEESEDDTSDSDDEVDESVFDGGALVQYLNNAHTIWGSPAMAQQHSYHPRLAEIMSLQK
jgi:hypothetical protein